MTDSTNTGNGDLNALLAQSPWGELLNLGVDSDQLIQSFSNAFNGNNSGTGSSNAGNSEFYRNFFANFSNSNASGSSSNDANFWASLIQSGGNNPYASGENPFEIGNNYSTPNSSYVGNDNKDLGTNNATIGNNNSNFANNSATIGNENSNYNSNNTTIGNSNQTYGGYNTILGNSNWYASDGSNNATLGNENSYKGSDNATIGNNNLYSDSSNNNVTLGNNNSYYGQNGTTIGNGNQDFGSNNIIIGNNNLVLTSNNIIIGNNLVVDTDNTNIGVGSNISNLGSFAQDTRREINEIINSAVGSMGENFVVLTGNFNEDATQTYNQLILSRNNSNSNLGNNIDELVTLFRGVVTQSPYQPVTNPQSVPESISSVPLIVVGFVCLLLSRFKRGLKVVG
ncbi:hypothetical protein [Anabaena azotica]|uniref:PPE family protein n=1 Tax=Anabaena azotica FACHB-119 TaxID=947527 RepID=A0ABR8D086_9NOST|nr:hypothetical protein [Anabaena azotica]MBD2500149.1 hypothetical protein [Anabaena azotica FACHB-119]